MRTCILKVYGLLYDSIRFPQIFLGYPSACVCYVYQALFSPPLKKGLHVCTRLVILTHNRYYYQQNCSNQLQARGVPPQTASAASAAQVQQ